MSHPFDSDSYGDIDRWSGEYRPEASGRLPGPDVLPDGSYRFEIKSAELGSTKAAGSIFKLQLVVLGGPLDGAYIERATFFDRPEAINYLAGELLLLGIPSDKWGKPDQPKISEGLKAACPQLKGMRFQGAKTTSDGDKRKFHNLYINARIHGDPVPAGATNFNEFAGGSTSQPAADPPW